MTLNQIRKFLDKEASAREALAEKEWDTKGHTEKWQKLADESVQIVTARDQLHEIIRPK